ncbi:hypothetical protein RFI_23409 [Reticulomyxa filosa]|uniref:Uncharacterized protein n=1 Tax=Reticulomyxa filosa TaxID=46433 RepID=X6MLL9_RETFI|nr:hypothetical protein RFI_23409 [Reticulomyxa filosa]|eukprot:ETO13960.1 hypothetical protein RFI_23409 [Reticulomyxa filosa]
MNNGIVLSPLEESNNDNDEVMMIDQDPDQKDQTEDEKKDCPEGNDKWNAAAQQDDDLLHLSSPISTKEQQHFAKLIEDRDVNSKIYAHDPCYDLRVVTFPPITDQMKEVFNDFQNGYSIDDICTNRNLTRKKFDQILGDMILLGHKIDWNRLDVKYDEIEMIYAVLSKEGLEQSAEDIKSRALLDNRWDDSLIHMVQARFIAEHCELQLEPLAETDAKKDEIQSMEIDDDFWNGVDFAALDETIRKENGHNATDMIHDNNTSYPEITTQKIFSCLKQKPQTLEELMSMCGFDCQNDPTNLHEMRSTLSKMQNEMTIYLNILNQYCLL